MKHNSADVIKFNFQKIEISQIPKLLPTFYRSKYSELRAQIVEKVNQLPLNESFLFAPETKQKMTDQLIGSICHGVNTSLVKENLAWRVRYSEIAKAFVVAPFNRGKRNGPMKSRPNPTPPKLEEKSTQGFTSDSGERLELLTALIKKQFNITIRQLQEKNASKDIVDLRRAMLYVGRNGLGLKLSELGALLGITSATASVQCQEAQTKPSAKEKVLILTEEINRN